MLGTSRGCAREVSVVHSQRRAHQESPVNRFTVSRTRTQLNLCQSCHLSWWRHQSKDRRGSGCWAQLGNQKGWRKSRSGPRSVPPQKVSHSKNSREGRPNLSYTSWLLEDWQQMNLRNSKLRDGKTYQKCAEWDTRKLFSCRGASTS